VDFRASQIESSDLRGLPDRQNGLTIYCPPEDLPHGEFLCLECADAPVKNGPRGRWHGTFGENGSYALTKEIPTVCPNGHKNQPKTDKDDGIVIILHEGILFLDELNRADDDVLQACFQLVLDRQLGRYTMPSGWSVTCAGNYQTGYNVNTFNDPAFLDRFCHVVVSVDEGYVADWSDYMTQKLKGPVGDKVLQFVTYDKNNLMGKIDGDLGFTVMSSPRSWEFVGRVAQEVERRNYPKEAIREVLAGIVGRDLANAFERFSVEVTPGDVLDKGLKAIDAKLKGFNRNQMVGLVWGVASHAKDRFADTKGVKGKDREKLITNTLDFMELVAKRAERDLAVMLGRTLVEKETVNLGGAVLSNVHLAKMAARYKPDKTNSWIAAISARPELQKLMSKVSYGS
jgi:hypothetical protein